MTEARRNAAISQSELGNRLGKPQSYVSKVETLERRLDIVEFVLWMKALDVNPDVIIGLLMHDVARTRPRTVLLKSR